MPDAVPRRSGVRVLLAPNAFKGTVTAIQACAAMAVGVRQGWPLAEVVELPMADGGDGFLHTLVGARGGTLTHHLVPGPLLNPVRAPIGWLTGSSGTVAVVELAAASGISLIPRPSPASAGTASTRGLGALIRLALQHSTPTILVGIGGSCSTDGGTGMARALGYRFRRADGAEIPDGGLGLLQLERIESDAVDPILATVHVLAACDVTNPLLGPQGAPTVYGPQKGADPSTVAMLEEGLAHLVEVADRDLGTVGLDLVPGSGAAGGTGFGLLAFCQAQLLPGVELVADACALEAQLARADLVITGEGHLNLQSLDGKVPGEVARRARKAGVPCFVIVGSSAADASSAVRQLGAHLIETNTDVSALGQGDARETARLRRRARADLRLAAARVCEIARPLLPAAAGSGPFTAEIGQAVE